MGLLLTLWARADITLWQNPLEIEKLSEEELDALEDTVEPDELELEELLDKLDAVDFVVDVGCVSVFVGVLFGSSGGSVRIRETFQGHATRMLMLRIRKLRFRIVASGYLRAIHYDSITRTPFARDYEAHDRRCLLELILGNSIYRLAHQIW